MGDAVLLGEDAGDDVHFIDGGDGDDDIRAFHIFVTHERRARAVGMDRQYVPRVADRIQLRFIRIDDDDVILLVGKKFRDNIAQMPRSDNSDTHII